EMEVEEGSWVCDGQSGCQGQLVASPGVQQQLQPAHAGECDDEADRVAPDRPRRACRQACAEHDGEQEYATVRRVVGLVPVSVERELHPQPPDRDEEESEASQRVQAWMVLERAGKLVDRASEYQVEEQLDPAGAAPLEAVTIRRPQLRRVEPHPLQPRAD